MAESIFEARIGPIKISTGISAISLIVVILVSFILGHISNSSVETVDSKVSVSDALEDIGIGLSTLNAKTADTKTGLLPTEIELTFDVTVSASDAGSLTLALADSSGIGGDIGDEQNRSNSNQFRIKFQNILTLPTEGVFLGQPVDDVISVLRASNNLNPTTNNFAHLGELVAAQYQKVTETRICEVMLDGNLTNLPIPLIPETREFSCEELLSYNAKETEY